VPLPGVPFDERRGVIPHDHGRVLDAAGGAPVRGLYATGWIKRGPSGVIGTNKADSIETSKTLLADVAESRRLDPRTPSPEAFEALVRARQPQLVTFEDWLALDRLEIERGAPLSRPRLKFTSVEEMVAALTS